MAESSKIQEINTVQWLCNCLLKIQVTCNYWFICLGQKIASWFLWFLSWLLISCLDLWFLTLISDFLPWFLISSLDFWFNVLISDFLTDFCDFFSWCTRFCLCRTPRVLATKCVVPHVVCTSQGMSAYVCTLINNHTSCELNATRSTLISILQIIYPTKIVAMCSGLSCKYLIIYWNSLQTS